MSISKTIKHAFSRLADVFKRRLPTPQSNSLLILNGKVHQDYNFSVLKWEKQWVLEPLVVNVNSGQFKRPLRPVAIVSIDGTVVYHVGLPIDWQTIILRD